MHDWNSLVRERLPEARLSSAQREGIVAELAGHLEELYEEQRDAGTSDEESLARALGEVTNWRDLARKIERAKRTEGNMNQTTRSFWLPAFITLTAAVLFEAILAQTSYGPRMVSAHPRMMLVIWPIWLAGQPFLGAIGAYASRRAGGTRVVRLASGLFPMIVIVAAMCIVYITVTFEDVLHGRVDQSRFVLGLIERGAVGVVIFPGLALLLGTLPFLGSTRAEAVVRN